MEIRKIEPIHVICFETETTMKDMLRHVRVVAHQIYQDAVKQELEITGPVYWIYQGADGQPDTKFFLTIAVPVTKPDAEIQGSEFKLRKLDSFTCISQTHFGDWNKLGETYGRLFGEVQSGNLIPSGETREIYLNMDFENTEGNITEVQIGIVS